MEPRTQRMKTGEAKALPASALSILWKIGGDDSRAYWNEKRREQWKKILRAGELLPRSEKLDKRDGCKDEEKEP